MTDPEMIEEQIDQPGEQVQSETDSTEVTDMNQAELSPDVIEEVPPPVSEEEVEVQIESGTVEEATSAEEPEARQQLQDAGVISSGTVEEHQRDLAEEAGVQETGWQSEFQKGQAAQQKFQVEELVRVGYTEEDARKQVEGGIYSAAWDAYKEYAPAEMVRQLVTHQAGLTAQAIHAAGTGYHSNFFLPRSLMPGRPEFGTFEMSRRLLDPTSSSYGDNMYMLTGDESYLLDRRHPLAKENDEIYDRIVESSDYAAQSAFEIVVGVPAVISKLGVEIAYNFPVDMFGDGDVVDVDRLIGVPQTGTGIGGEVVWNIASYAVPIFAAPRLLKLANGSKRAYAAAMAADGVLAYTTTRPEVGGMASMLRDLGYDTAVTRFLDTRQFADQGWWGRNRARFIASLEGVGLGMGLDLGFKLLGVGPKTARWLKGKVNDAAVGRKINDTVLAIVDRDMRRVELMREGHTNAEIEQLLMDEGHGLNEILDGHLVEAHARMLSEISQTTANPYSLEQAMPIVRRMWSAGVDFRKTSFMGMQRDAMPDFPNAGLVTLFQKGKVEPTHGALASRTLGELEGRAGTRNKRSAMMGDESDTVRVSRGELRRRVDGRQYRDGDLKGNESFGSLDNPNISVTEDDMAGILDRALNRTGEKTFIEDQLVADAARSNKKPEGRKRVREGQAPYQFAMPDAQFIREALALPDEFRYWYELTGEVWKERVRGLTPAQQEVFFRALSQHSARTNIKENMDRGVAMFSDLMGGRPTSVDSVAQQSELAATYRGEGIGPERMGMTNYKVPSFAQTFNFLFGLDSDAPMSVQDAIMSQMFGMAADSAPNNAAIFEFFHSITDELTNHLNAQLVKGAEPYETWQVQALLWTRARRDSTAMPGYLSTGEVAEGFHQVIEDLVDNVLPAGGIDLPVDPETGVRILTPEVFADPRITAVIKPNIAFREQFPLLRATADQVTDPRLKEVVEVQMRYDNMLRSGEMVTNMTKKDQDLYRKMVTGWNNILKSLQSSNEKALPGGGVKQMETISELAAAVRGGGPVAYSDSVQTTTKLGGQEFGQFNSKTGEWFGPISSRNGQIGPDLTIPMVNLDGQEAVDLLAILAKETRQSNLSASRFTRLSESEVDSWKEAVGAGRDPHDLIVPELWVPGANVSIEQVRQLELETGLDITVRPSATGSTVWAKPKPGTTIEPDASVSLDAAFDKVFGDADWDSGWAKMDEITVSENGWYNASTGERGSEGINQLSVMAEQRMMARDVSDDMGHPEWMGQARNAGPTAKSRWRAVIWDNFLGTPEAREQFLMHENPRQMISSMVVSEAKELGKRFQRAGEVPTKSTITKSGVRKKAIDFERIAQDNDPEGFNDAITEAVEARNGKALTDNQRREFARQYVVDSGLYPFSDRELKLLHAAGYGPSDSGRLTKLESDYGGAGKALRDLSKSTPEIDKAVGEILDRSSYVRQRHHRSLFGQKRDAEYDKLTKYADSASARIEKENVKRQGTGLEPQFMKDNEEQVLGVMYGDEEFGNAIIALGNAQTLETVFHEGGHALRIQAITGPNRGKVLSMDTVRAIEAHYGVRDGRWKDATVKRGDREISADEAFAEDFAQYVMEGEVPEGMKLDDWKLLTAQSRDQLETIRLQEQVPMSEETQKLHQRLMNMQGLPIRMPNGTYVAAIEWDDVVRRVQELQDEGKDWMDILDETDTWVGTRRMNQEIKAGNVPGKHSNTFKMDINEPDDLFLIKAVMEDLHRTLVARGVVKTDAATRAGGMRLLNASLGRSPSQFTETVDELMTVKMNKDDLAEHVWASNAVFISKGRQIKKLGEKADRSGDPRDLAILHKAMMDYHYIHASIMKMQSNLGRGLRALKLPAFFPKTKRMQDPKYVEKYIRQMGLEGPIGKDLIEAAAAMDVPNDIHGASMIIKQGVDPWGKKALNVVNEVYVNGLLSGLGTVAGISIVSPLLTMTVQGAQRFVGGVGHAIKTGVKGGGLQHMDWSVANEVVHNFQRNMANMQAARIMAGRAAKTGRGILQPGREIVENSDKAIYTDKGPAIWQAVVNWTGTGIRLPQRGIMTVDEYFRQVAGRTAMQSRMYRDEMDELVKAAMLNNDLPANASIGQINAYKRQWHKSISSRVNDRMDQVIRDGHIRNAEQLRREALNGGTTEDGRVISEITDELEMVQEVKNYVEREGAFKHSEGMASTSDLVEMGEAGAVDPVFQADLEGGLAGKTGAIVQQAVDTIPGGRLVVPFVRTPWNIAERFGGYIVPTQLAVEMTSRTGSLFRGEGFRVNPDGWIAQVHYKHMQELGSGDPSKIAHARGRQAMGVALWTGAAMLAYNGTVTGGGPTDPNKRKAWLAAGNRPYSIMIPGLPPISYAKLDPYASVLGTMADTFELAMYYEGRGEDMDLTMMSQAAIYSFTNQLKEKSFVQGISDLITAIERSDTYPEAIQQYMNQMATNITTPFSSLQNSIKAMNDPYLMEYRTLLDTYRAKSYLSLGSVLGGGELPPRYTVLGEPMERISIDTTGYFKPLWNFASPARVGEISDDPLMIAISKLGAPPAAIANTKSYEEGSYNLTKYEKNEVDYPFTAFDYMSMMTGEITLPKGLPDGSVVDMTLREYLESYILSPRNDGSTAGIWNDEWQFMESPEAVGAYARVETERSEWVRDAIKDYRGEAFERTRLAFPELWRDIQDNRAKGLEKSRMQLIKRSAPGVTPNTQSLDYILDVTKNAESEEEYLQGLMDSSPKRSFEPLGPLP